jgi:hypothetical protein
MDRVSILLGLYPRCGMHHGFDTHLDCSDGMNLDCFEVMTITVDYGMAIISPHSLCNTLGTLGLVVVTPGSP